MKTSFKVVDLFAGPGGLAEGFAALRDAEGHRPFDIALSVEKEASAFKTLRLRAFVRQFGDEIPDQYYRYLARDLPMSELSAIFPDQWDAACEETLRLELGTAGSQEVLDPLLERVSEDGHGQTVLIGGPPCQAYSLVGRARNRGVAGYVPSEDKRHYLYEQYIRIIGKLQPVAFVMENVKGILSARVDERHIFSQVLADLGEAGGSPDSYRLIPLVALADHRGSAHVIESERFGVPQCRHRVILMGVRLDLWTALEGADLASHRLEPVRPGPTVHDVLAAMPGLRSGLSRSGDTDEAWRKVASTAFRSAAAAAFAEEDELLDQVAEELARGAEALEALDQLPPRASTSPAAVLNNRLAAWLVDPRLSSLPNHEARGHMEADLARYAFAAVFAKLYDRSPKAREFPEGLAPAHQSWASGKFADRFRVQRWGAPSTTITSHISKDGHYFIHPDPLQCRSLTVREAARLQTFPDNYLFEGNRTEQYIQVGNAVPPLLAFQIAEVLHGLLEEAHARACGQGRPRAAGRRVHEPA
jgi:DNA (cytosine-5)-methyltransferase 1